MSNDSLQPDPENAVIPYARQSIDSEDIQAVTEVLQSDFLTQGPRVAAFEAAVCELTGARYAIAVSSGTAALHLANLSLDIGAGDCGIVPAITFAATANALRLASASVRFCDVDPQTGLAGVNEFRSAMGGEERLKGSRLAFMPVSYSGSVPDLPGIRQLADQEGAFIVEDAAHGLGAQYRLPDGSLEMSASCRHSDAAILSFHPVKHICAGEGGMLLTNDGTMTRRARRLRSHGIEKADPAHWSYQQIELGLNYRITDIQAALGLSQLGRLSGNLQRRREIAQRYSRTLCESPYVNFLSVPDLDTYSALHLYVVRFKDEGLRKRAYEYFHDNNIRVQVHYMPVYQHEFYRSEGQQKLPGAETFYSGCLSLPLFASMTDAQQTRVIEVMAAFCEHENGC